MFFKWHCRASSDYWKESLQSKKLSWYQNERKSLPKFDMLTMYTQRKSCYRERSTSYKLLRPQYLNIKVNECKNMVKRDHKYTIGAATPNW